MTNLQRAVKRIFKIPLEDGTPHNRERIQIPGHPGFYIQYPVNLTRRDVEMIRRGVDYLKSSIHSEEPES